MVDNNLIGISGKMGSGKDTVGKIIQDLTKIKEPGFNYNFGTDEDPDMRRLSYSEGPTHEIKKFADKLKDIVCLLIGCTREQLEDRDFKEAELGEEWWIISKPEIGMFIPYTIEDWAAHGDSDENLVILTPRLLLQLLGTEAGRQILHPNIWINALFANYNHANEFIGETKDGFEEWSDDIYPNWIITDVRFPNEAQAIKDRGGIVIRVNRNNFFYDEDGKKCLKIDNHPSETALDDYKDFDHIIENNGSIEDLITKLTNIFQ